MFYENGMEIKIEDCVHFENEPGNGIVIEIIDSIEKQQRWGVESYGIMVQSKHYGRAFYSTEVVTNDPPILITRASQG